MYIYVISLHNIEGGREGGRERERERERERKREERERERERERGREREREKDTERSKDQKLGNGESGTTRLKKNKRMIGIEKGEKNKKRGGEIVAGECR